VDFDSNFHRETHIGLDRIPHSFVGGRFGHPGQGRILLATIYTAKSIINLGNIHGKTKAGKAKTSKTESISHFPGAHNAANDAGKTLDVALEARPEYSMLTPYGPHLQVPLLLAAYLPAAGPVEHSKDSLSQAHWG
jgi:hypothetical protein